MLQRKSNKAGASRKSVGSKKADLKFWHRISLKPFLIALAIAGNATVLYYAIFSVDMMLDVPVHNVEVQGILKYQSKQEIQDVINDFVGKGYVRSDLEDLRRELLALPWIEKVSIKRRLNNELLVVLEENSVAAYWNDGQLLNTEGYVFQPKILPSITGLPKFSGGSHVELIALYDRLRKQLSEFDVLAISALAVDNNKTIKVVFSNGIVLTMNKDDLDQQLNNFIAVIKAGLDERLEDVATIDLRYRNGAAVAWRKNNIAYNQKYVGAKK